MKQKLNKNLKENTLFSLRTSLEERLFFDRSSYKSKVWVGIGIFLCLGVVLYPEFASATKLEDQLDKFNALTTTKLKTYGISAATISGMIWALFKGNVKLSGIIIAIGVMLAFFLKWVDGGMQIG